MFLKNVMPANPRHGTARWSPGRALAVATAALIGAGGSLLVAGPAFAAPAVSTAEGRFLSGSALGVDLDDILTVEPAGATNTGGATVTDVHPLNVTALNAVNVDVGPGLNLLGENGILTLGAVNQYAAANGDGSSSAASGAVTNTGGIGVGGADGVPQSDATLDLSGLIGADLADALANVQVSTGALSATATQAAGANGAQDGDYQIAGLTLGLTSPALAGTVAGLGTTLDGLQPTVDGVVGTLNGLDLGVVNVTGLPNLRAALDSVTTVTSADGSIVANLQTGAITVDVAAVLASQGLDLNDLPANTELLPYITDALSDQLLPAITTALTGVVTQITSSLQDVTATVGGVAIPAAALLGVINPVIETVVAPINTVVTGLGDTVVTPLATALTTLLSLQANGRGTTDGTFTQRALRIGLLPTAATPAAIVDLASASVGPNAGPTAAVPVITGIDPGHGPATGGTTVTLSGSGFTDGSTVSVDGGDPITPNTVSDDGTSLTFTTPPHVAGDVAVTVTSAAGTSPAETFTYDPAAGAAVPVITGIDPGHGPATGGTTVTLSGSGFTDGSTVSVDGGDPITPNTVSDDGTSLTFTTPPHVAGDVAVTVTSAAGTSPAETFTYDPAAGAATPPPVLTSPTDGSTVSTGTPPISGTGTPGDTVTVTDGDGSVICTATVAADGRWSCTPAIALADGDHVISATQSGPDGTSDPSNTVRFTIATGGLGATVGGATTATGVSAGGGTLAYTGTDTAPMLLAALLLLLAGAALTIAQRHRRRRGTV